MTAIKEKIEIDETVMTGEQLRAARLYLGLSQPEFGRLLGFEAENPIAVAVQVARMEKGERTIRKIQSLMVHAYLDGWRPNVWPRNLNEIEEKELNRAVKHRSKAFAHRE